MTRNQDRNLSVVTGGGKKNKPGRDKIIYFVVLGILLLLFIQVGYQWANSWLYFRRVQIAVAEEGTMDSLVNVSGVITRDETVVTSPVTGFVLGKIPEGERVPVGGEVVTVLPDYYEQDDNDEPGDNQNAFQFYYQKFKTWFESLFATNDRTKNGKNDEIDAMPDPKGYESVSIRSPRAGVVSYSIDGWEEKYLPDYPYDLLAEGHEVPEQDIPEKREYVAEGEPLFKLVNNWEWFFSFALGRKEGEIMANRKNVDITFSFFPHEPIRARLVDIQMEPEAEKVFLTYKISRQIPGFTRYRWAEAEISYHTYEGIKIPRSAIIDEEGATGVFLNDKGIVVYYPVNIIYEADYDVIVDGIPPNSIVIIRPDLVNEGQRLE